VVTGPWNALSADIYWATAIVGNVLTCVSVTEQCTLVLQTRKNKAFFSY